MNVKIIRNEQDYEAAMTRLSALMSLDPETGSSEEDELELLTLVIQDFERQTVPPVSVDPVEAILFRMDQMGLTRKDMVHYMGSASKVSEVLSRKRPLSLSMIRRLHKGLGIPADILIDGADADVAMVAEEVEIDFSRFPLKEMHERGCFAGFDASVRKIKDHAEDLIRPFMQSIFSGSVSPAFLRAPIHQRGDRQADSMAILAWRLCVLRKAREAPSRKEYKAGTITPGWLRELAKLSSFEDGPGLALEYLARYGITLVVEKHFDRTFLDGAAMLDGNRPVVALTLRHDRIDNFWFVLLHELAHVGWHLGQDAPVFIDDLDRPDHEAFEEEADALAREALIPASVWANATVRRTRSAQDAVALADELGVHPAIVAGRLRNELGNYKLLAQLIGKKGQVSQILDA